MLGKGHELCDGKHFRAKSRDSRAASDVTQGTGSDLHRAASDSDSRRQNRGPPHGRPSAGALLGGSYQCACGRPYWWRGQGHPPALPGGPSGLAVAQADAGAPLRTFIHLRHLRRTIRPRRALSSGAGDGSPVRGGAACCLYAPVASSKPTNNVPAPRSITRCSAACFAGHAG